MAEPYFSGKIGCRASFLEENRWPSLVSWGKQEAKPRFLGKTGG